MAASWSGQPGPGQGPARTARIKMAHKVKAFGQVRPPRRVLRFGLVFYLSFFFATGSDRIPERSLDVTGAPLRSSGARSGAPSAHTQGTSWCTAHRRGASPRRQPARTHAGGLPTLSQPGVPRGCAVRGSARVEAAFSVHPRGAHSTLRRRPRPARASGGHWRVGSAPIRHAEAPPGALAASCESCQSSPSGP